MVCFAEPRSGLEFQSNETQQLQLDSFANPGLLWVDQGKKLWQAKNPEGKSCASCHGEIDQQRGVATHYPKFDEKKAKLINLTQKIEDCRTKNLGLAPLTYESDPLLALTTAVTHQSQGLPLQASVEGKAKPFFYSGLTYFYQRRGQMNLACHHCHDQLEGRMLRGDQLSQGQSNGYPSYRLTWQGMGSLHRRLRFCNQGVRAQTHALGSDTYVNLELFLAWRAGNLPLETPSVRR